MKRRTFGLLAGTSMLALLGSSRRGLAQTADFATLSKTTLTPFGAERAGNTTGSIPAWTGGATTLPDGWSPDQEMPDLFASDQLVTTIDSSNLEQYKAALSDGVIYMIQNDGLSLQVYPTHRTAAAPQYVYDNIAANAPRAQSAPGGARLGFTNAYGGIPFPLPDPDSPDAGAQIIWNHNARWQGFYQTRVIGAFVVNDGGEPVLTCGMRQQNTYPYYDPNGSLATFDGYQYKVKITEFAPSTTIGN